ncbi:MAG: hypothetical protein ABA06_00655 [Parcubacteria bacterium C7867-001]|nr:MAG: hypothetical protein ABA06_00655 [Parcubacteria bacterium C7867-001]
MHLKRLAGMLAICAAGLVCASAQASAKTVEFPIWASPDGQTCEVFGQTSSVGEPKSFYGDHSRDKDQDADAPKKKHRVSGAVCLSGTRVTGPQRRFELFNGLTNELRERDKNYGKHWTY